MIKLLFICLGNICRSPIAEGTFKALIKQKGLEDHFEVDSAGTAGYHIGKKADPRTLKNAEKHGIELDHTARKISAKDLDYYDHLVVMDEENFEFIHTLYYDTKGVPPPAEKLFLIRDHDPEVKGVHSVIDPFYEGEKVFEEVFQTVWRSNEALIAYLCDKNGIEI
jgi:protein-tyrosine phosphatase